MKKTLWIAAAGALLLAGCKSPDVMDERNYYGPNPDEVTQLPPAKVPAAVSAPVAAPATEVYEPMTNAVSTGGVDSIRGAAATKTSTYVVRKGDTLGKIAANHGVKLSALMAINNIDVQKAKQLRVGQKLTIPGAGAAVKSSTKQAAPAAEPKLDKDGFYVIQSGDNIPKIARRFKVKSAEILNANNLSDADSRKLQIGQKIVIPGKSPAAVSVSIPAAAPETEAVAIPVTTEVVPVEVPAPVAVTESVSAPAAAAPVVDLSKTMIIEVSEESISLADFAKKRGVDVETLHQLNQGCSQILRKGDPIVVPIKD